MRARNFKPSFFVNETLVELPALTRLLYIGLWCMADRRGLLADRPKKIKMAVLPADDMDVDQALDALAETKHIERYTGANGVKTIRIINFLRHQTPHHKEQANPDLMEPGASLGQALGKPESSLGQASVQPPLNPESGILNPESGGDARARTSEAAPEPESPPGVADAPPEETRRSKLATRAQQQFAARLLAPHRLTVAGWLEAAGHDELLDSHVDEIRSRYGGRQPPPVTGPRGHELPQAPDPDLSDEDRAASAAALAAVKANGRRSTGNAKRTGAAAN